MGQQDERVLPIIYVSIKLRVITQVHEKLKKSNKLGIRSIVIRRGHRNWEPAKLVEVANARRTIVVQT